ncbi:MAG: hypothetical protein IJI05_00370 [Erysipelotrichaceae bacterium]|nr:hypothetical protein [Erysipelotrichaceae bacterium]
MPKLTDWIKNTFGGNKEEAEKKVAEVTETVQKTAEKVTKEVKETATETANQVRGFSRAVAEKAEETVQKAEEKTEETVDRVKGFTRTTAEKAAEAAEKAEETAKSARKAMLEKAAQVREKVEEKKQEADIEAIAKEVIQGKWGNGQERADKLRAAGYDYQTVQTKVNDILHGTDSSSKPAYDVTAIAKEVIRGKWGNGAERKQRLTDAGYDYKTIQSKVNELLHK